MKTLQKFILFAMLTLAVGTPHREPCQSPQYIELAESAIIKCYFDKKAFAILWYNSTDYSKEPILYFKEGVKSGVGFISGEFDIMDDGSLIIGNVSLRHDHYFTAVKLNSSNDDLIPHMVLAVVTVTPSVRFPHISKCTLGRRMCYVEVNAKDNITCAISGSRPAIPLQWVSRTANSDVNATSNMRMSSEGIIFSTFASVNQTFYSHPDLVLLVCKAIQNPSFVSFRESIILVQNKYPESLLSSSVIVMVQYKTEVKLTCPRWNSSFLVWKMKLGENDSEHELAIFISTEDIKETLLEGYLVDNKGSLVIPNIKVHQEGIYYCFYGNGLMSGVESHHVIVYVLPTPQHPVIDGCLHQDYCVLEKQSEGYLTCRLFGIRPKPHLEWNVFPRSMSSKVTFSDYSRVISQKGDLFDITLTAIYRLNDASEDRVTVECKGSIANVSHIHFSTKLDLFFIDGLSDLQTKSNEMSEAILTYNHARWIIPIAIISGILFLALIVIFMIRKAGRKSQETRDDLHCEETVSMISHLANNEELSEKKNTFIKELTAKYEEMCSAVHPVPFIRNRYLQINKAFVDGGIEFLQSSDNRPGREKWGRLSSYDDLFTDQKVQSKRYILEAAAGYGKSTLCLQLVHDWYSKAWDSSIKRFEVLIFLRLRQVGEGMSIFQAIRHLLLPQDSHVDEEEVRDIILSCKSVLIVLDGYDEYIHNCSNSEMEIAKIMERDIFQSFEVVLTTRPSCMPKGFAPKTTRIRLVGFDENARDLYISKAVVDNDCEDAQRLKKRLGENPVLRDLCQVPLFFAMFAHLTHEKGEFEHFISVTSFFRYIMSCIYAHISNKASKQFSPPEVYDHSKLDKVAFDSLAKMQEQNVWMKENIIDEIGSECFEKYVTIGVLTVEEVFYIVDKPGVAEHEHVRYIENVRFHHDVFREWYAAHYLAKIASEALVEDLNVQLNHHSPFKLQYTFRFACGLSSTAGERIIQYLKQINVSDEIVILCVIEKTGAYTNIIDTVNDLCSRAIEIRESDSKMMQRATAQLLDIAFRNQVAISCLRFWNCFANLHKASTNSKMDVRILLPNLRGISHIEIYENDRKLESSVVKTILCYVSTCKELKTVAFFDCLLPMSFDTSRNMNLKVTWYAMTGEWYTFDTLSRQWKKKIKSQKGLECETNLTLSEYEEMIHLLGN